MPLLINQKFPRCTLCGKMFPLKVQPIALGQHQLCSERCVRLLYKLRPEQVPQEVSLEQALAGQVKQQ
ncbi:MAG: hypothetical protein U0401_26715 [Anaerolineae bacterium]